MYVYCFVCRNCARIHSIDSELLISFGCQLQSAKRYSYCFGIANRKSV